MSVFYPQPEQCSIVYGRFPYPPDLATPGPEPHYCLVLDVFLDKETSAPWVIVSMGTSKNVLNLHSGEFAINSYGQSDAACGLSKPTKFGLNRNRIAKLPYNEEYFCPPPGLRLTPNASPKIGILDFAKYQRAFMAAGVAANVADTIKELESIPVGMLPR